MKVSLLAPYPQINSFHLYVGRDAKLSVIGINGQSFDRSNFYYYDPTQELTVAEKSFLVELGLSEPSFKELIKIIETNFEAYFNCSLMDIWGAELVLYKDGSYIQPTSSHPDYHANLK